MKPTILIAWFLVYLASNVSQVERIGPMTHSACTDQLEQILGMTPKPVYAYCTEEY